ncbi:methyltransferase domain-containing protein [Mesorhizobium neociceri]|uniref:Methyltransferase domain-containing protein n=1 Tax=Mesorhizobium neociceri TaxID=1307853 RepID=A0A838BBN5_9HYPH|nr:methyltransferase domain-containing protein [Mesorhizobium neociceri]MBA1143976.1 methyltransferase domain-containing protein [Mesorhizobium neociceri]
MNFQMTMPSIDPHLLQGIMSRHLAMYRSKVPFYQATMLDSLRQVWAGDHRRLLDVGGGTGVIAQAMSELFPLEEVQTVDLVDRFCPSLSVSTRQYDGKTLPFRDDAFDAATLNNVMHHVPLAARAALLREIRRVVDGPLYIKDHESRHAVDRLRLTAMDAIGNIPFGGMVWARYLDRAEWERLVAESGYRIAARAAPLQYRKGLYGWLFPNRLEITLRLERV